MLCRRPLSSTDGRTEFLRLGNLQSCWQALRTSGILAAIASEKGARSVPGFWFGAGTLPVPPKRTSRSSWLLGSRLLSTSAEHRNVLGSRPAVGPIAADRSEVILGVTTILGGRSCVTAT